MKATIRTISKMTGFSPATVSNALSGKRGVNKNTVERILHVAREIGYTAETKITQIKLVLYREKGSVVNDSPFFSMLFSGIEMGCRECGYAFSICNLDRMEHNFSSKLMEIISDMSSALIVLATEMGLEEAKEFQKALTPVVILDNWYEELSLDSVLIDNTDAVYKAVKYLILKGHKRIGYLRGNYEIKNFYYRKQGYLRALRECGLAYNPEHTYSLSPNMKDAYRDLLSILQTEPELPTAFIADNDMIALGAARALQQAGYEIPKDISLIGFDDLPFCAISNPPLSTIRVFNNELGYAAVHRLVELIQYGKRYCAKIQVRSMFMERDSVRNLNVE